MVKACGTQDQGVWGSISIVVVSKIPEQVSAYCLWPPSRNGYLVEEETYFFGLLVYVSLLHLNCRQGDETEIEQL